MIGKKFKNFVGVYFNNENWAVVPQSWIFSNSSGLSSYWPGEGNPIKLAQQKCLPDKNNWNKWPIARVAATSDDFSQVEGMMLSDCSSSSEDELVDVGTTPLSLPDFNPPPYRTLRPEEGAAPLSLPDFNKPPYRTLRPEEGATPQPLPDFNPPPYRTLRPEEGAAPLPLPDFNPPPYRTLRPEEGAAPLPLPDFNKPPYRTLRPEKGATPLPLPDFNPPPYRTHRPASMSASGQGLTASPDRKKLRLSECGPTYKPAPCRPTPSTQSDGSFTVNSGSAPPGQSNAPPHARAGSSRRSPCLPNRSSPSHEHEFSGLRSATDPGGARALKSPSGKEKLQQRGSDNSNPSLAVPAAEDSCDAPELTRSFQYAAVEKRLSAIEKEQASLGKMLKKSLFFGQENNLLLKELHENILQMKRKPLQPLFFDTSFMEPAATLEELAVLLAGANIIETLRRMEASSLKATLRAMLKRLMTRALAVTFSFTGLDGKRLRTKTSLREHGIYRVLLDAIDCTSFGGSPRQEIDRALKCIMKNVADWENFRASRRKNGELQHSEKVDDAGLNCTSSMQASYSDQNTSLLTP